MSKLKRVVVVVISLSFLYILVSILTTFNVNKTQLKSFHPLPQREGAVLYREDVEHLNGKYNEEKGRDVEGGGDLGENELLEEKLGRVKIPYRVVHLDLKGAPVKINFYETLFRVIRNAGGNCLLLEYEDMFPFTQYSHRKAHTKSEIQRIISLAKKNELEVIPLVQTFGHLEFVLKLEKFAHLREVPEYPQEICPSKNASFDMVKNMIDEVMSLHAGINYMHIGCDEVYHIGECEKCKSRDVKTLFLDHVMKVSKYLKDKYKVRSIIWDDMLRKFYAEDIVKSGIGNDVELMVWDYTEEVDHLVSPYLWPMYTAVFPNIWVASAFKGAFGESLFQVQIQRHALNHLSWLKVLSREYSRIKNLRGIAITGWSRYDHFSVLCELLPIAVPSMLLSLFIVHFGNLNSAVSELGKTLKCEVDRHFLKLDDCQWTGKDLFETTTQLAFLTEQTSELIKEHRSDKGWLSAYQLEKNYTSPWRLQEPLQQAMQHLESVKSFESLAKSTLSSYYPNYVIDEWMQLRVKTLSDQLVQFIKDIRSVSRRRFWPQRPLLP